MYAKKTRYHIWAILILVLLLCAMTGTAVAKYVTSREFSGTVTFSAKLAEDLTLQEHKALRRADGSYQLGSEVVTENSYTLLPGLDIPKDPFITITGKTPIEAYLFVEVVEAVSDTALVYSLTTEWKKLDDVEGKNNGAVYVYVGNTTDPIAIDNTNIKPTIYILSGNQIEVKQTLSNATTGQTLTFYASMGEIALGENAAAVYKAIT